jgi:formylglycine-generating enzyme required for sulfatase activity
VQDDTTTEDGAYTITAMGIAKNSIVRNPGAKAFVPSGDEWYKAAYYETGPKTYFDFPAGTDTATACATPGSMPNTANCGPVGDLTTAGSYTGAASPNGTIDQGGNVFDWVSDIYFTGTARFTRGGRFSD